MKTRDVILLSVTLSWGMTIATLVVVQRTPTPWRHPMLQSGMIVVGGEAGQGTIMLDTHALDGGAMMTMSSAGGGGSIHLAVSAKGFATVTLNSGKAKPAIELDAIGGQPRVRLFDQTTGLVRWSVTLDASGQPVVEPK